MRLSDGRKVRAWHWHLCPLFKREQKSNKLSFITGGVGGSAIFHVMRVSPVRACPVQVLAWALGDTTTGFQSCCEAFGSLSHTVFCKSSCYLYPGSFQILAVSVILIIHNINSRTSTDHTKHLDATSCGHCCKRVGRTDP